MFNDEVNPNIGSFNTAMLKQATARFRSRRGRRTKVKVHGLNPVRAAPSRTSRVVAATANASSTSAIVSTANLRSLRSERRDLLKRLADADYRAKQAEALRDDVLADTSTLMIKVWNCGKMFGMKTMLAKL